MKHIIEALNFIGHIIYSTWWVFLLIVCIVFFAVCWVIAYTLHYISVVFGYLANVYVRQYNKIIKK
jgi:hypothetical protein